MDRRRRTNRRPPKATERRSKDRRVDGRPAIRIAVTLSAADSETIHASNNLSPGGVFFGRAVPYPVGTRVEVTFQLPGDDCIIRCGGQVVGVAGKTGGMAIHFIDLGHDDAMRVTRFASTVVTALKK